MRRSNSNTLNSAGVIPTPTSGMPMGTDMNVLTGPEVEVITDYATIVDDADHTTMAAGVEYGEPMLTVTSPAGVVEVPHELHMDGN